MPFVIQRPTPSDVPEIVDVHDRAMATDAFMGKLFCNVEPTLRLQGSIDYFAKKFTQARHMGFELWKAVDTDTGKIVGMIVWEFPRKLNEQEIEEKAAMLAAMSKEVLPQGANSELLGQLVSQLGPLKAKYVDPTKDYYMRILAVDPHYQRRGLGSMLIEAGVAHIDEHGADSFLTASVAGEGLYLKHGWEPIDEIVIDLDKANAGHGITKPKYMLRKGRTSK